MARCAECGFSDSGDVDHLHCFMEGDEVWIDQGDEGLDVDDGGSSFGWGDRYTYVVTEAGLEALTAR